MYNGKNNGKTRRIILLATVICCHVFAVLIPGCAVLKKSDKKENAFRVKLGDVELNSGPVVGPPVRLPAEPPAPPPPEEPIPPQEPVAEPDAPVIPAPEPPAPPPEPKQPVIPKEKPKPKPKQKPKQKPEAKPKQKAKAKVKPKAKPKTKSKVKPKPKDDGVYKPNGKPSEIGRGYNAQNNARIPVGNRNAAQRYGKIFDNRNPGGGASESMERYGKNLVRYLKSRWTYPPKSLLGGSMPSVLIELDIAPGGRVVGKRIVERSGINAMDQSIERMLDQLEQVPSPPDKRITLEIRMQMTDD